MKIRIKIHLIALILLANSLPLFSQNIFSEYHQFECADFYQLTIPFYSKTDSLQRRSSKTSANSYLFYSSNDRFAYWYRINIREDHKVHFRISTTDPKDSFSVFLYRYNEQDFCRQVQLNKIKPLDHQLALEGASRKEQKQNSLYRDVMFNAAKGEMYYLCILRGGEGEEDARTHDRYSISLSLDHQQEAPLAIKPKESIEFPAPGRDVSVRNVLAPQPVKRPRELHDVVCRIVDEEKGRSVDASFRLVSELTGEEAEIQKLAKGEYRVKVEKNKKYKVECYAMGYKMYDYSIDLLASAQNGNIFPVLLEPLKAGNHFVMKNIYFHPNTYALKKESKEELQLLLEYLRENPSLKIEVQGHTNGNSRIYRNRLYFARAKEWNFQGSSRALSKHRSLVIKHFLMENGIPADRISTKGYGGDRPLLENPRSLDDIQKNIRVEIVILKN